MKLCKANIRIALNHVACKLETSKHRHTVYSIICLVQMIAQVFGITHSVHIAIYYWFYSYVHTNLQTVSNHVCKPFLSFPHSVTTPTATINITTVITSSSCIAPLRGPSFNTIFSPVTISDSKPSNQHHLVQFNLTTAHFQTYK